MGSFSMWHWLIVLLIVLILFGRGRISEIMGDFGKGIKSFKDGVNDGGDDHIAPSRPQIASHTVEPIPSSAAGTSTIKP